MKLKYSFFFILLIQILLIAPCKVYSQIEVVDDEGVSQDKKQLYLEEVVTENEMPYYLIVKSDFDEIWVNYKNYILKGNYNDALSELERFLMLKSARNIERLTYYSSLLIADAYVLSSNIDDQEIPRKIFEIAQKMDPLLPEAYLIPYIVNIKHNFIGLLNVGSLINGIKASLGDQYNRMYAVPRLFDLLLRSLILSGFIFTILVFIKYQKLLRHDISELTSYKTPDIQKRFYGWLILSIPFLLWLGFEYILIYLLVVLLPYGKINNKLIGLLVIVSLLLLTPWIQISRAYIKTLADKEVKIYLLGDTSFYTNHLNEEVDELRRENPNDINLKLVQTNILLHYGKIAEAYNAYKILNSKYPNRMDILINMGNIRYQLGEYELAKIYYQKALDIEPNNVKALYNFKLATEQKDPFRDTSDMQREIQRLDKNFYDRVFAESEIEKKIVSIGIGELDKENKVNQVFSKALYDKQSSGDGIKTSLFFNNQLSIVSICAIMALFILSTVMKGRGLAQKCLKCGNTFCKKCKVTSIAPQYCSQCNSIFFSKEGVSSKVQRAKLVEINRFKRSESRLKFWLSIFIPGSSRIYEDKSITGFFVLLKWAFLIYFLFLDTNYFVYPFKSVFLSLNALKIIALIFLIQTQLTSIISGLLKFKRGE